jgi:cell division protein FtsQ
VNAKTTIRRILFIAVWLCIGGGMLTLLLAAISNKKKGQCTDYTIKLKAASNHFFISEQDVEQVLLKANQGTIKGRPVEAFNLHELEMALETNEWISRAELYFDNNNLLHVTITEKEPIARVFTTADNSFYIDSLGNRMPLSDKYSARVPVFTGFPDKKRLSEKDSLLLNDMRTIASFINKESFWMSQVAQLDITKERKFEMVPVVGTHIVKLGDAENIAAKFNRLMVFYRQVLSKTGFDRYKLIDVQYKGQVVASRYSGDPRVDSVQLRKNVEKLLKYSMDAATDTVVRVAPVIKLEKDSATMIPDQQMLPREEKVVIAKKPTNKNLRSETNKKTTADKPAKRTPKAVMPKKETVEEEDRGY